MRARGGARRRALSMPRGAQRSSYLPAPHDDARRGPFRAPIRARARLRRGARRVARRGSVQRRSACGCVLRRPGSSAAPKQNAHQTIRTDCMCVATTNTSSPPPSHAELARVPMFSSHVGGNACFEGAQTDRRIASLPLREQCSRPGYMWMNRSAEATHNSAATRIHRQ